MDFKKIFSQEPVKRAARTFIQAAIGYLTINITLVDFSNGKETLKSTLLGLLASTVAAGISAIMNINKNETEEQ